MIGTTTHWGRARTTVRALALLLSVGALIPASGASAQEPHIEFTIRPAHPRSDDPRTNSWLIHRARPGDVIRDEVIVENLGDVALDFLVYPADAENTAEGEFGLEPIQAADDGVAGWVSVRHSEISLAPDEARVIPVTIRVPPGAPPGDHPGAVVIRTAEPIRGGQVPTLLAVGARLYLTVAGPTTERLELHGIRAEVEDGTPRFVLDIENTGNTIAELTGSYRLRGFFGLIDTERPLDRTITVLPGARIRPQVVHDGALLGGTYRAEFALDYAEDEHLRGSVAFSAGFPWPLVALILILVALIAAVVAWVRRSRRRRAGGSPGGDGHRPFDPEARAAGRAVRSRR